MKKLYTLLLFIVVVAAPYSSQSKEAAKSTLTIIGQFPTKWRHGGITHRVSQRMFRRKFHLRVLPKETCVFPPKTIVERMSKVVLFQGTRCIGKSCKRLAELFVPRGIFIAKKKTLDDERLRGILK